MNSKRFFFLSYNLDLIFLIFSFRSSFDAITARVPVYPLINRFFFLPFFFNCMPHGGTFHIDTWNAMRRQDINVICERTRVRASALWERRTSLAERNEPPMVCVLTFWISIILAPTQTHGHRISVTPVCPNTLSAGLADAAAVLLRRHCECIAMVLISLWSSQRHFCAIQIQPLA